MRVRKTTGDLAVDGGSFQLELEQAARLLRQLEASTRLPGFGRSQSKLALDARLSFPSVLPDLSLLVEDQKGQSASHVGDTLLANSTVVSPSCGTCVRRPEAASAEGRLVDGPTRRATSAVSTAEFSLDRLAVVRKRYSARSIPDNVSNLLLGGNRDGTLSAYQSAWRCWYRWCRERTRDPVNAALSQVLEYLTFLFETGRSYRTINVHRSMLSSTLTDIENLEVGKHPLVRKLLKAVYNLRTPRAKYASFWDADKVLERIRQYGPTDSLPLKGLTLKTVLILALATFARVSELASIEASSVRLREKELSFSLRRPRKTQSSGPLASIRVNAFVADREICPVHCVMEYVKKVGQLRETEVGGLFVAIKAPHTAVGKSTIARWVKLALFDAEVDTGAFSAHSTRGAAASKAYQNGTPCDRILATASWKRASTFHRFYNKRIDPSA